MREISHSSPILNLFFYRFAFPGFPFILLLAVPAHFSWHCNELLLLLLLLVVVVVVDAIT